jgi:hypothetical protein
LDVPCDKRRQLTHLPITTSPTGGEMYVTMRLATLVKLMAFVALLAVITMSL